MLKNNFQVQYLLRAKASDKVCDAFRVHEMAEIIEIQV